MKTEDFQKMNCSVHVSKTHCGLLTARSSTARDDSLHWCVRGDRLPLYAHALVWYIRSHQQQELTDAKSEAKLQYNLRRCRRSAFTLVQSHQHCPSRYLICGGGILSPPQLVESCREFPESLSRACREFPGNLSRACREFPESLSTAWQELVESSSRARRKPVERLSRASRELAENLS